MGHSFLPLLYKTNRTNEQKVESVVHLCFPLSPPAPSILQNIKKKSSHNSKRLRNNDRRGKRVDCKMYFQKKKKTREGKRERILKSQAPAPYHLCCRQGITLSFPYQTKLREKQGRLVLETYFVMWYSRWMMWRWRVKG
jgi:hypothetical protein